MTVTYGVDQGLSRAPALVDKSRCIELKQRDAPNRDSRPRRLDSVLAIPTQQRAIKGSQTKQGAPRSADLSLYTDQQDLRRIETLLNARPRKKLRVRDARSHLRRRTAMMITCCNGQPNPP